METATIKLQVGGLEIDSKMRKQKTKRYYHCTKGFKWKMIEFKTEMMGNLSAVEMWKIRTQQINLKNNACKAQGLIKIS